MKRLNLTLVMLSLAFLLPWRPPCAMAQGNDVLGVSLGELHNDPNHFLPPSISGISSSSPIGWQKVAAMGAAYARFDIPWSSLEWRPAGAYALNAEKSFWITQAHAVGLKVAVIVLAGNLGTTTYSPPSDVYANPFDATGYSNACAWLAKTYLLPGDIIEVLNEPQSPNQPDTYPGFTGSTPNTAAEQSLVAFTSATTTAVHAANPGVKVIGLGCQGQQILDMLGMNPIVDGVVAHPYCNGSNGWPETTYEPPYLDYEAWVSAIQAALPPGIEYYESEFSENNVSSNNAYVRAVWMTRRGVEAAFHNVKHWFPHGLIFNAVNGTQFLEWVGLGSRMSYYSVQSLFGPAGVFNLTPSGSVPAITGASTTKGAVKSYVFTGTNKTVACFFYSGNNLTGYSNFPDAVTVSFPTTLTNVSGSYALNLVSGLTYAVNVTVSNGVATVTGAGISNEAVQIVLEPGPSTAPLAYTKWLSSLNWEMQKTCGNGPAATVMTWIKSHPITPDPVQ